MASHCTFPVPSIPELDLGDRNENAVRKSQTYLAVVGTVGASVVELIERLHLEEGTAVRLLHDVQGVVREQHRVG